MAQGGPQSEFRTRLHQHNINTTHQHLRDVIFLLQLYNAKSYHKISYDFNAQDIGDDVSQIHNPLLLGKCIPLITAFPAPAPKLADTDELFDIVNEKHDVVPLPTKDCDDCLTLNLYDGKGTYAVYDIPIDEKIHNLGISLLSLNLVGKVAYIHNKIAGNPIALTIDQYDNFDEVWCAFGDINGAELVVPTWGEGWGEQLCE